ncbi:MAG: KamA family radical SAM protein, partial [Thermodesulfobacteriota bacterium]|nr:KamA family radical SAM protein [Thermodesulfobacteriota bacterium]
IISQVREIEHVQIIRIGSKIPAYNPYRILNDPSLALMLKRYSSAHKKIYLMTQFNHPNELTHEAVSAIHSLLKSGVLAANQTPLLRGINDNPHTLSGLFKKLSFIGVPPYYVFICRPTSGNRHFAVPVEQAYTIFHQAQMNCSGLAKRARLAMSHATGKIEVTGMGQGSIYFRYHRAADDDQIGDFVVCKSNPNAFWFDDYKEPASVYSLENPYRCYGPE